MLDLTINKIFFRLDEISRPRGVVLSFSTKNFYVFLLEYCDKNGLFDESRNAYYADLSYASMRKEFGLSMHVIQKAIASLSECGLIEKLKYEPSFSQTPNRPSRIYIFYSLLKEES